MGFIIYFDVFCLIGIWGVWQWDIKNIVRLICLSRGIGGLCVRLVEMLQIIEQEGYGKSDVFEIWVKV